MSSTPKCIPIVQYFGLRFDSSQVQLSPYSSHALTCMIHCKGKLRHSADIANSNGHGMTVSFFIVTRISRPHPTLCSVGHAFESGQQHFSAGGWLGCVSALDGAFTSVGIMGGVGSATSHSQVATSIAMITIILLLSFSFVGRYDSIVTTYPWRNLWLVATALVALLVEVLVAFVRISARRSGPYLYPPPVCFWVSWLIWLVLVVLIDERVKAVDKSAHEKQQKYLRLLFTTRLGMWSPK
eukprot:Polyplicarium_translucidae@DN2211_c0_g1_i3.p1